MVTKMPQLASVMNFARRWFFTIPLTFKSSMQMEVGTDIEEDKGGFASFIRYKGIHYTADTLDEFFKQVEEIKAIAR